MNRSVVDQIVTLKQVIDSSIEQNLPLHVIFITLSRRMIKEKRESIRNNEGHGHKR